MYYIYFAILLFQTKAPLESPGTRDVGSPEVARQRNGDLHQGAACSTVHPKKNLKNINF